MAKPQLVLLHFAGGNAYSFQFLKPLLSDFELIVPELPGRGKRMDEDLVQNFDLAAEEIFNQLIKKITAPEFLIYGHSMGAYLALRVSHLLEKTGKRPLALIVSGNAGPGIQYDDPPKKRYLLPRETFIEELKILGGVPPELFDDEEVFLFFEPILRADFEIAEENGLAHEPPASCPLFAMMGSREEKKNEITNWGKFTSGPFGFEILEGGHFFIYDHPTRIAGNIHSWYYKNRFVTI